MKLTHNRHTDRSGVALVASLFLVMSAATAAMLMVSVASTSNRRAELMRQDVRASYLAEGALLQVEAQLREHYLDSDADTAGVYFLEQDSGDIGSWFANTGTIELDGHTISYTVSPVGTTGQVIDGDGFESNVALLEIETRAELPGAVRQAHSLLQARVAPIYQHAVFFNMNLDVWPGGNMTITGRIHANGDLYVGGNRTLRFDTNHVRATGDLIQDRASRFDEVDGSGQVQFRRWVEDPFDSAEPVEWVTLPRKSDLEENDIPSQSGLDSRFLGHDADDDGSYDGEGDLGPYVSEILEHYAQPDFYGDVYGSTIQTGEHGVEPALPPSLGSSAMFVAAEGGDFEYDDSLDEYVATTPGEGSHTRGTYHDMADLSIIVSEGGSWSAWSAGVDVTAHVAGAVTIDYLADVREGYNVDTAEIDLVALAAAGHFPSNGLLYLGAYGSEALTTTKGFVLKNGSELPAPLTTVSENSLYIQGDYNTVDKKPAAVIADTVNLLSSAWDGTKELDHSREDHVAVDTTYNVAIVAGHQEAYWGTHTGGLENYVRLHEHWSGRKCTIRGSFVALWEPRYTTRPLTGKAYSVPTRDWYYEEGFSQLSGLPPFTPCYLELQRISIW